MTRSTSQGFTLVELMVTIAVAAILAAIAFPSFQSTIRSNRMATSSNEILGAIALARTEAVRSTNRAQLCASANGAACSGADWNAGILVQVDNDGNGSFETAVRYVQPGQRMNLTIASGASEFAFDNRGRLVAQQTMTLRPLDCPSGQQLVRTFTLTLAGQPRMEKVACP